MRLLAILAMLTGCAELGVVGDGTSVSVGKPSRGYIVDGQRLPDRGQGFVTKETWAKRGNRYGTDELIDLLTAVSRRMSTRVKERLVVADLSCRGGGDVHEWHRSHQSGRDVDLVYYVRDADGKPVEPDAMHVFGPELVAKDGSGLRVDIPRTWMLARELLTAPEATVQWVFMYQPIANKVLEYAQSIGEPEALLEKARKAMKQPADSAPHNDHIHVRVFCTKEDRALGCQDYGPMDLYVEREAELAANGGMLAAVANVKAAAQPPKLASAAPPVAAATATSAIRTDLKTLGRLMRTRTDRIMLPRWR
ncbi:MAG TPA: penicillin-insensitive murein endopeptidase [Kofleriaceae bacterium]|nr:penicillin-insensitive murein endopeptidase [Kofleriaceae bacterium]